MLFIFDVLPIAIRLNFYPSLTLYSHGIYNVLYNSNSFIHNTVFPMVHQVQHISRHARHARAAAACKLTTTKHKVMLYNATTSTVSRYGINIHGYLILQLENITKYY